MEKGCLVGDKSVPPEKVKPPPEWDAKWVTTVRDPPNMIGIVALAVIVMLWLL